MEETFSFVNLKYSSYKLMASNIFNLFSKRMSSLYIFLVKANESSSLFRQGYLPTGGLWYKNKFFTLRNPPCYSLNLKVNLNSLFLFSH